MFITVGLLLLTALYIGMVMALKYKAPVECMDELCQSEGVDNTIINWSSDFFVAFWMFLFALHLSCCTRPNSPSRKSGILSQIFMGGAFVMAGMGHWLYPNSGIDDNHGMLASLITWMLFAVFFTMSGLSMVHFARSASKDTNPDLLSSRLANHKLALFFGVLLMLSMSTFLAGSVWCSIGIELQVNEVIDEFEPTEEINACFVMIYYSEMAMNLSYALLWLPVGFLLGGASQEDPVSVLGLPTPIAALIALLTQWTTGSILLVLLFLVDLIVPKINYFDAWNMIYGTVLYHWAMLMTLYCLHNLSYGLPLRCYDSDDENGDDGPAPLSWEWWVTMVASSVPEPKQKTKSHDSDDSDDSDQESVTNDSDEENSNKRVTFEILEEEMTI